MHNPPLGLRSCTNVSPLHLVCEVVVFGEFQHLTLFICPHQKQRKRYAQLPFHSGIAWTAEIHSMFQNPLNSHSFIQIDCGKLPPCLGRQRKFLRNNLFSSLPIQYINGVVHINASSVPNCFLLRKCIFRQVVSLFAPWQKIIFFLSVNQYASELELEKPISCNYLISCMWWRLILGPHFS